MEKAFMNKTKIEILEYIIQIAKKQIRKNSNYEIHIALLPNDLKNNNFDEPFFFHFLEDMKDENNIIDIKIEDALDVFGYKNKTGKLISTENDMDCLEGLSVYIVKLSQNFVSLFNNKIENLTKRLYGSNKLIDKDSRGGFWYDGIKITMSKEAVYYKIFDILYESGDQNGYVSYKEIIEKLNDKTRKKIDKKTIYNGISETQGLFRYAKINGKRLENKTLDKKNKLIDRVWGKGLILNNFIN